MPKFCVHVDLGLSGFNFYVQAADDLQAAKLADIELRSRGVDNDDIESIRIEPL